MMKCQQCCKDLAEENLIVSISGSIMGDECTDAYYFCPVCKVYSVETRWDNFTGIETSGTSVLLSQEEGDVIVNRIKTCDTPWDKKCRCESHRRHFNDTLD